MIGLLAFAAATLERPATAVRCGAVERPGVAMPRGDGHWRGRAVDLCRSAATAMFGAATGIDFHVYRDAAELATAPDDQLAFLSPAELDAAPLQGALRAGPVVAIEEQVLLVPTPSPIRRRDDLAGRTVCFMIGGAAEDALDAWALAAGVPVRRIGFQEPDELRDAYAVGKCAAMALDRVEAGEEYGADDPANRVLADELARVPIRAAIPLTAGPAWRAIVDGFAPLMTPAPAPPAAPTAAARPPTRQAPIRR